MQLHALHARLLRHRRQSIGGDNLRQLRANLHFSSTFATTLVPPSFTTETLSQPELVLPQKMSMNNGAMNATLWLICLRPATTYVCCNTFFNLEKK